MGGQSDTAGLPPGCGACARRDVFLFSSASSIIIGITIVSGRWAAQFDVGDYLLAELLAHGAQDNDGSSIVVTGAGCQVTLYENGDFTGWESTFGEGSVNCCDQFPNDQVSSIRVHGSSGEFASLASLPPSSVHCHPSFSLDPALFVPLLPSPKICSSL